MSRRCSTGWISPTISTSVCILLMAGSGRAGIGGGRIVRVADMVAQIMRHVGRYRPEKSAVPTGYPLLRTLQLAANFADCAPQAPALIPLGQPVD